MIKYKKILYKPQFSASDPFIFLHALLQKIVNNWIPIRRYYFCIISFFSHQNINASLKRFLMRWCLLQHPSNKTSLKISIYCRLAINNSPIPFLFFVKVIYHASSTRCGIILTGRFCIIAANECKFHYIGKLLAESYINVQIFWNQ